MRLRRLDLIRYGIFSERLIDFGDKPAGNPDLHVIYGPNEAGKSTMVAAYLDLLYGIKSGRYAFLHQEGMLRIGAAIEIGGTTHEFVRIKNGLLDGEGRMVPESAVRAELGAIERDGYLSMFSLDDDSIEKGGNEILQSKGDLGQLLFAASTGLSELSVKLGEVRATVDEIHKSHGQSTQLKKLRVELDQLKVRRDEIDIHASKHAELIRDRDQFKAQYDTASTARNALKAREDELRRKLAGLPILARLRGLRSDMEPLVNVPSPPSGWKEELPELNKGDLTLGAKIASLAGRIDELGEELDTLVVEDSALAMAVKAEALDGARGRYQGAIDDIPNLERRIMDGDTAIRTLLVQLGKENTEDPALLLLDSDSVTSLRDLMEQRSGIETAKSEAVRELKQAEADLAEAEAALVNAGGTVEESPSRPAQLKALTVAITAARSIDHPGRVRAARRAKDAAASQLSARLTSLAPWEGKAGDLLGISIPGPHRLGDWRSALNEIELRIRQHREETRRLNTEISRLNTERDAIAKTTGLITDDEAARLRAAREKAWGEHRRRLDEETAEIFEVALRQDDQVVSVRIEHAQDRASLHQVTKDIAVNQTKLVDITRLTEEAESEQRRLLGEIAEAASGAGLPAGTFQALPGFEEWLVKREHAIAAVEGDASAEMALREAQEEMAASSERLDLALKALEVKVKSETTYEYLLAEAESIQESESTLATLRAQVTAYRFQLERRQAAADKAMNDGDAWAIAWRQACAATWLGDGGEVLSPAWMRMALETIGKLEPAISTKADLERRVTSMKRDQEEFKNTVVALAAELAIDASDPLVAADKIKDRVRQAEIAEARRRQILSELTTARAAHQKLVDDKASVDEAKQKMTAYYGVSMLEEVGAKLAMGERHVELRRQIETAKEELVLATCEAGVGEAELFLEGADRTALEGEMQEVLAKIKEEDDKYRDLFALHKAASVKVDAIGSDAAVAEIEEKRRTVMAEIEDQTLRYLRLKMGSLATEQALRIYRDRHRSGMMAEASDAFRVISRGAYSRLQPERRKDSEILVAVGEGGSAKDANQLSKGTRFQLYLALRVAGYREFARSRSSIPFVCDDIMETFDDFRAEEAFRILAGMANLGQVIYLTHHRHLCQIARDVYPGVVVHQL